MKTLFIDESGDLGKKGRYFVIALLVPQNSKRILNFMRDFCAANHIVEIKGSLLSFPQKQMLLTKLNATTDYAVSYIVADKKNIENKRLFQDKNLLYNYLVSFLVKEIAIKSSEGINIVLDNHSMKVKSTHTLANYLKTKAYTEWDFQHELHVSYIDSKESKLIQAVDLISNAIYAKYVLGINHLYNTLNISESIRFPYETFGLNLTSQKDLP